MNTDLYDELSTLPSDAVRQARPLKVARCKDTAAGLAQIVTAPEPTCSTP